MNFMSDEPLFLIDTNVLVYAYNIDDLKKQKIAKELLNKCWKRERTYAISSQNLAEFFYVSTKKIPKPLSLDCAEQLIHDIAVFSQWKVINYTEETLLKAVQMHKKTQKKFWDAVLAATMLQHNVTHIYTEDIADFKDYSIIAVNPFK